MGIAGIGIWQLLIIVVIARLIFGSGRLRSLGGDLGGAIRGFRKSMGEDVEAQAGADNPGAEKQPSTGT